MYMYVYIYIYIRYTVYCICIATCPMSSKCIVVFAYYLQGRTWRTRACLGSAMEVVWGNTCH